VRRQKGKKGDSPFFGEEERGPLPTRLDLVLEPDDAQRLANLGGPFDAHLRQIELRLGIEIRNRGNRFRLVGPEADINRGEEVLRTLFEQAADALVTTEQVHLALTEQTGAPVAAKAALPDEEGGIVVRTKRGVVRGRSARQREYLRDIATHDLTFGVGPAGTGKCIAASSLVLTDRGLLPIGELGAGMQPDSAAPIGIQVAGLDGTERASHVYDGGVAATRRIRTRLGLEIEATPEHPLLQLRPDGSLAWTRADQLGPGDFVAVQRGQNLFGSDTTIHHRYRPNGPQDHAKPVHLDQIDEEVAYILGALTGDGCLTFRNRVILSTADEAIAERFRRFAARFGLVVFPNGKGRPYDHIIASSQLYQLLLGLGMSPGKAAQKRIPHAVLRAPRPIVAAFVRGLFDTDGTASRRDGYPSLCSASDRLIAEVQIVLLNFGILAARRQRHIVYRGEDKTYHELEMRGAEAQRFYDEIGFGLARKQALRTRVRASNTNVDVLPHVALLLDTVIRGLTLSRALHKRLGDYRTGRRCPSYPKLAELMGLLAAAQTTVAYSRLQELLGQRLFWAEVVDTAAGEAHVFDLTVPGSHSFCANGFVNHNTYLAVASAVQALEQDRVRRIVLTRPAVEAGEKLGFLPGDMAQKVDPYLRPLYDALYEMLGFERVARLVERAVIEVAPLAFMRGRAQPYFSKVLTPRGWRPIGTLEPGDSVIGSDGRPTEVLGVYPRGRRPVYRVTAQDGASTLCCDEHLWTVYTPEDRNRNKAPRTLETREMIGRLRRNHQHRYELPLLSAPALFQPRYIPMEPYALGLLLGDGCLTGMTTPTVSTADPELAKALERELHDIEVVRKAANSRYDFVLWRIGAQRGGLRVPNPVTVLPRELQLCGTGSHTKFVPRSYLYNSPEVRLGVLQGLLDTDGGPVTQHARTCRIQYCTTSPQLRDDVVFLVRSLGGVAYWRTRAAEGRKPGRANGRDVPYRHDAYVVGIRLPAGMAPFRLERKAAAYVQTGGGRPMRYIESIEPVGIQDVMCIKVAAPDSLYVTDDFLVTHNTLNESFVILDEAQNTSVEQMKMFLTRIGFGSVAVVTGDVTQIDLPRHQTSGLKHTLQVLEGVAGIKVVRFEKQDVVRHPLVQAIVHAYEIHEAKEQDREK
jgi:phosphate starvation-inducible protein PhoH and related proteins